MSTTGDLTERRVRPARLVALVAATLGLGVSIYLTIEHYSASKALACPETAAINCLKVTTSKWSTIVGVPVAVVGLAYFVVMVGLLAVPMQRRSIDTLRLVGAAAGVVMVFYLVYVELFNVNAICLWCSAVHLLTVVMFVVVLSDYLAVRDRR